MQVVLTREIRHGLQLLLPELGDGDALFLLVWCIGRHPLLVGMLQDALKVLRLKGFEDVEEVLPRRSLPSRICIREVHHELGVLLKIRPQRLHRKFIVVGDGHLLDLALLHQLLLSGEDILQEVFVDDIGFRQVILDYRGIRRMVASYLRCLLRYVIKSVLLLNFHASSWAFM